MQNYYFFFNPQTFAPQKSTKHVVEHKISKLQIGSLLILVYGVYLLKVECLVLRVVVSYKLKVERLV